MISNILRSNLGQYIAQYIINQLALTKCDSDMSGQDDKQKKTDHCFHL